MFVASSLQTESCTNQVGCSRPIHRAIPVATALPRAWSCIAHRLWQQQQQPQMRFSNPLIILRRYARAALVAEQDPCNANQAPIERDSGSVCLACNILPSKTAQRQTWRLPLSQSYGCTHSKSQSHKGMALVTVQSGARRPSPLEATPLTPLRTGRGGRRWPRPCGTRVAVA